MSYIAISREKLVQMRDEATAAKVIPGMGELGDLWISRINKWLAGADRSEGKVCAFEEQLGPEKHRRETR